MNPFKSLVSNHLMRNREEMLKHSISNCHAMGAHSVMLVNAPGHMIRLYFTTPNHELYKNHFQSDEMSVGYHPHHCDITLHCLRGVVTNSVVTESFDSGCKFFKTHTYDSKIKGGSGKLKIKGDGTPLMLEDETKMEPGEAVILKASDIHTIYVEKEVSAAWLVFEGKEDPKYKPYCYAPQNLSGYKPTGLYGQMTEAELLMILDICGLT